MDINKYMIDMKNLIEKSFFLVCCLLLVACGGEDLNKYKEQYLDAMAKDMKTTKEFHVKDLDVVIDSMRIIPITVADSIYLLEEFSKMDKKQIAKMKKEFKEYKKMEGLFMLFGGNNKEQLNQAKEMMAEVMIAFADMEKAVIKDLPKYKKMDENTVLAKILSLQLITKDAKTGVHTMSKELALFSPEGLLINLKCPLILSEYLKERSRIQ